MACSNGGEFDIAVPLSEPGSSTAGWATLHCSVSPGQPRVALGSWQGPSGQPVTSGEVTQRRIDAALEFVATHRICGSRHLCPSEVVDIVDRVNRQR